MTDLFEWRLIIQLADHIQQHNGLARLAAGQTVAESEVALAQAQIQDVPRDACYLIQKAVSEWKQGREHRGYLLDAFWTTHLDAIKFRPVKLRFHVHAPQCFQSDSSSFFYIPRDIPGCRHGGALEHFALGEFKGECGRFPDDIVLWWEADLTDAETIELAKFVQPGSTLTLLRPDKTWWLGWASLKFEDRLPSLLYTRYQFTKVYAVKESGYDMTIIGIEGLRK